MIDLLFDRQNRNFQRLWWAQLISQFGDRVNQLALVGLIAGRVPGSAMELAKLLAFTIVPVFLIQPFAGVFVDRWDRRTTLFVCDAARGALVLLIPFAFFYRESMVPIYIIVFLAFCFSRFYSPAKMSILPDLVASENLLMANSLVTTTGMIAFVLGCALGGFIVDRYGARAGFIIDGVTFFISGALVFSIDLSRRLKAGRVNFFKAGREFIGPIRRSVWGELREGMRYLVGHRELRFTIGIIFAMLAAAGAVYVVIIVFIQESFQSVTRDLGVLAVFLGLGLFTGALIYGRWGRRFVWYKTMFFSLMAGGAFLIAFALLVHWDPRISSALLLAFFLGLVIGPIFITANMIVQVVSDDTMRGKVFSALEVVIHLAFLTAMLVSSWLAEFTPKFWILVGAGVLCAGIGLTGLGMKHRLAALTPGGPPDPATGGLRRGDSRGIIKSGEMADLFDK
ncbi:MAG: MFS transporter [Candidatus Omnitrophica bacterium]|nr:MFS transporter [Candidatus Omnitrophota bacterium]